LKKEKQKFKKFTLRKDINRGISFDKKENCKIIPLKSLKQLKETASIRRKPNNKGMENY